MDEGESGTNHWNMISFVISSDYRLLILNELAADPKIPSQIATDRHVLLEHVSRAIQELRNQELVELRVPEEQEKQRLYGLTERGDQVWQRMRTAGLV